MATLRHRLCFLLLALAAAAGVAARAGAADAPHQMEKFNVNEKHLLCFGLAITLWEDKNSGRVMAMYIKDVAPGSMAEAKGLRAGTRIWAIDGLSADGFDATFAAGSQLADKFLNRKPGDKIVLEVSPLVGDHHSRLVVLEQSPLDAQVTVTFKVKPPPADWNWKPEKQD